MEKIAAKLRFRGIVQGVGFRPFLHNLASRHGVVGYVRNLGDAGVELCIEGDRPTVETFVHELRTRAPPICQITDLHVAFEKYSGRFHEFAIYPSDLQRSFSGSIIPPDIAICDRCASEVLDATSRWYLYPFTCCASCGPRFSAVMEPPYDRDHTNMNSFPMCRTCLREYQNPDDRRFHAQGICCSSCGPRVTLYDRTGKPIEEDNPLEEAARLLNEGAILGVKGIGGIHVSASAICDDPLRRIRTRKAKPFQPFAVMSRDLAEVRKFAFVSDLEARLLEGWRRPIVALRKLEGYRLSELVSPNLNTVGVMLPYTGIHLLLAHFSKDPALVMTSGNISGLPMAVSNDEGIRQLSDIVDYFVLHDREITARCDDSVVRVLGQVPTMIRRSRGYVPVPVEVPFVSQADVVGLGAELRSVGSVLHGSQCYLTQHIGDVDRLEAMGFLKDALEHLIQLVGISHQGAVVAHDAHPGYLSSRLAKDLSHAWKSRTVAVQHHHAHAVSLMAENSVPVEQSIVAIAADGIGFGLDGKIWGGEILVTSYKGFERIGHLAEQPMPGGDVCTRFPLRMCAAMLAEHLDDNRVRSTILSHQGIGALNEQDLLRLTTQIENHLALSWTSSTGRVLDAMAAGVGICLHRTYEGEPAMMLEAVAQNGQPETHCSSSDLIVQRGELLTVDTTKLLLETLLAIGRVPLPDICATFQGRLSRALAYIATEVARSRNIRRVGVTGGVAVNLSMVETIRKCVEEQGLTFLQHKSVPPGDGGLSLGQAIVASQV
ncbi:carbamoyltransferase HypF [Candidatus Bathyarchaeota archaeon]|nr:carbamoyltransferase HypF [Candidatus Bathyarchaeota archaeon]